MQRFTIGRLANAAGVTVETIRYYERKGLLARPVKAGGTGYREYGARDVAILQHIRLGKKLGLKLLEMRALVGLLGSEERFCRAFQELLEAKLSFVRAERERLQSMERELAQTLAVCTARIPGQDCPIQSRLAAVA